MDTNKHLQLDFTDEMALGDLNAHVNQICDQAEKKTNAVLVFHFKSTAPWGWPGPVSINHINLWERTVRRLERLTAVTITVVSGAVTGPCLDLLLATDYRITSNDFRLKMPVNDKQVWPGMALYRLVNQVGLGWGRRLFLGTHEIKAQSALDIGLIDEIADITPELISSVVLRYAGIASVEISVRRQLLLEAQSTSFEDARGTYLAACDRELRRLSCPEKLVEREAAR